MRCNGYSANKIRALVSELQVLLKEVCMFNGAVMQWVKWQKHAKQQRQLCQVKNRHCQFLFLLWVIFCSQSTFAANYLNHHIDNNQLLINTDEGAVRISAYGD